MRYLRYFMYIDQLVMKRNASVPPITSQHELYKCVYNERDKG